MDSWGGFTPADCHDPHKFAEPDTAILKIANGAGEHSARNVIGGEFLHLVRLGLRDPHDPIIVDSLAVSTPRSSTTFRRVPAGSVITTIAMASRQMARPSTAAASAEPGRC